MAPKTPSSLPLYEVKYRKNIISRGIELFILFLLFSLLAYRFHSLKYHGFQWLLALICESWFTFLWILTISTKWSQVEPKTYPLRLLEWTSEFPAVDMFVTTADPVLEPPLITVNTVLSLLAVDYPANKLACYVSDDGASIVTYYSLVEASKFAKLWVPFCKKYNIALRAPFRYFRSNSSSPNQEFLQDWKRMKDEYKQLCEKIEDASSQEPEACDFAVFSNIERKNHPTIIKVIWEKKEGVADGLPHLVYISREKRPKHPHHFKAGAMNLLTRVSGVMTNAPFMLNVDCDMYANNPQVVLHAMCYFLGAKDEKDCGFVQFPQYFYDGLKEDPYGNQLKVLHEYLGRGISGIQGPFYQGTGCFHRRKVIYGLSPHDKITAGELKDEYLQKIYGKSQKLSASVAKSLSGGSNIIERSNSDSLSSSIEIAHQVGSCGFEFGTAWGQKKRDTCEDLAPLVWNTFNAVYILLLEVIAVYRKLLPSMLSMKESTRACNALALFQVMANNPETRRELIKAKIPCYFYPFLKPNGNDKPLEYLRLTSLGVLGSLTKFDDPYGPQVLHFFLETKVVPLCLECMDLCDELSRKVATLIVMKILMQEEGMTYCCTLAERFYSIVQVLCRVVEKLSEKPCLLHLKYVIQCYLSLSEVLRFIGPCDAFRSQVPHQLFDNTFKDILRDEPETSWMLQLLHFNIYGYLYFQPNQDIANQDTTVQKAK